VQGTGGALPPYPPWWGSRSRRSMPQALPDVLPAPAGSAIQATFQVGLFRRDLTRLESTFAPPYWVAQAWNSPWGVWSVLAELSDRARGEVMAFPPPIGHALLQAMVLIPIFWEHPEEALYAVLPFIIRLLHGRDLCFFRNLRARPLPAQIARASSNFDVLAHCAHRTRRPSPSPPNVPAPHPPRTHRGGPYPQRGPYPQ